MRDIYEPETADCCANCWYCESGRCCCDNTAHYMDYVADAFVCGCYKTVWQGEQEAYGR